MLVNKNIEIIDRISVSGRASAPIEFSEDATKWIAENLEQAKAYGLEKLTKDGKAFKYTMPDGMTSELSIKSSTDPGSMNLITNHYFGRNNYSEITARLEQIKSVFGKNSANDNLTYQEINFARNLYNQYMPNNNMTEFLNSIIDSKKLADWAKDKAIIGGGLVTFDLYNTKKGE
jgi:hypothetical protein